MKLYTVTFEIGVDDNITEETIRERLTQAIAEDITEAKLFRINDVKNQKVASGMYRLHVEEALRLGLADKKK